jgi:hypothetical protein
LACLHTSISISTTAPPPPAASSAIAHCLSL